MNAMSPSSATRTDRLSWGVIEFQVTDLARAVAFWTQAFGLRVRHQTSDEAELGTQAKTLIVMRAGAKQAVQSAHLGMYHVAIGVPDQAELSRVLARLISQGVSVSPTDHLASKSLYFADPDGLEIEIVLETPERFGRFGDMSKGLILYDVDGNPHSGRAPLDVAAELQHAAGADLEAPLSEGAFLAHLHFKVDELQAASAWFEALGFEPHLMIPNFGFADMGAGNGFSHRLAMNIWAGPNLTPAPADMARLTRYTLHALDANIMQHAKGVQPTEQGLAGIDPSGTELVLLPSY